MATLLHQFNEMKRLTFLLSFLISVTLVYAQSGESGSDYQFETMHAVEATAVKSQDRTGTCWSFSSNSFLESELLRMNKGQFDLSEMYSVYRTYQDKGLNYMRYHGKANFSEGSLNHDVFRCLEQFGAMPEAAYAGKKDEKGRYDHSKMVKLLTKMLEATQEQKGYDENWSLAFDQMLNIYMGEIPETFEYKGKSYTAISFRDEVLGLKANDYVSLTSFSHHENYSKFILEVPDNYSHGSYYNLPLESLEKVVDHALAEGFSIAWDADVSDPGFSARNGLGIVPAKNWGEMNSEEKTAVFDEPVAQKVITSEMRQTAFDSYKLTDDHLMHITGLAKDQHGDEYYVVKNSWGSKISFDGYMYISKAYFNMNTIAIVLHKDGIPKGVLKSLKL